MKPSPRLLLLPPCGPHKIWAVVVAQLVERSLPLAEVCGSNPVIGKIYIEHLLSTLLKRQK